MIKKLKNWNVIKPMVLDEKWKKENRKDDWIDYSSSKNANFILSIISENFWLTSESA